MKRNKPLRRYTPPKRKTPVKKITETLIAKRRVYNLLRAEFLASNPECQLKHDGCTFTATQVHHSKGRGKKYLDTTTFVASCHNCHRVEHGEAN